jgi:hypothetical protein
MFPRSRITNAIRLFGGISVLLVGPGTCASAGPPNDQRIIAAAPEDAAAIARALRLLPRRPETVAVIDPDGATPEGRKILRKADAFITKGGRIVYVNRQSEVLEGARRGSAIHVHMLAGIIWHEMAHIQGADEPEAQRREESMWKRFLLDGRVDRVTALRYLNAMNDRHR